MRTALCGLAAVAAFLWTAHRPAGAGPSRPCKSAAQLTEMLDRFDSLEPITDLEFLTRGGGQWVGKEVATGHAMDGLLDVTGWYGKRFVTTEHVDPLLWRGPRRDPRPFTAAFPLMASHPLFFNILQLARHHLGSKAQGVFIETARLLFSTPRSQARLRLQVVRGQLTAVMVYDHFPIIDAFKKVDENTVLGIMDEKGDVCEGQAQHYFFEARRENATHPSALTGDESSSQSLR
jgi:hypothetical protein